MDAANRNVATARKWVTSSEDSLARARKRLAESELMAEVGQCERQVSEAKDNLKEAQQYLEGLEKRHEVIDVDDDESLQKLKKQRFSSNMRIPVATLEQSRNKNRVEEDRSVAIRVEEDRSVAIEACIVRIMKARKTLAHQQLIAEVLSQLAFFKPQPRVIKKRIEALIDREYLERSQDNSQQYNYLP